MTDKTMAIATSLLREFIYRTVLAYVLLHVMALIMPMSARADTESSTTNAAPLTSAHRVLATATTRAAPCPTTAI